MAALPHFRFSDREELCDLEITAPFSCRIEVKTWSMEHWPLLGRCVAVEQFPALEKKADRVLWCLVERLEAQTPENLLSLPHLCIELAGWSTLADIKTAPIRKTGTGAMRKVNNYQLDLDKLRNIETFLLQNST